ncbi:hypothetical protein, variant [Phytophthora nicotianae INRA-310]|uniref:Peroxisome biogenesis protein 22 n=2 Tax=Phytophthora nicotianae TaxID=4792 RepID=W2QEH9_PHYN3|nr:hypothetical protein PPTG_10412 [Phytophthora nicotianae INRA-310]XP_008903355.1 hypothetical protein, variant [Phytophthora nicotianae INRA-310]KUF78049.1 Peroxisome biogenesis protein 22 [Phytophthora nicotianae]ETN11571.1 hypothetical protein PPTG_10412 [Phytophthora nicotianae INRA-310]ETN11572.1 hypothetical protein, variant [Phytophthora nicotianae INRA-310]KUF90326.1 Peroxisome biogenesis protein 22 [Phytophthora nicotianae]KUF98262.1 hypothetical protein AM588_10010866 [Phytophthor
MSAKSPEVVDGMIDDSLLGILIILLVVMLSTGYVYVQQLRQGDAPQRGNAAANLARMAPSTGAALASAPERAAISTAGLTDRQLRLHFTLPMHNGARTVTISGDALLKTENPEALAWTNDEVPALLADLSHVCDVHLLFMVKDAKDAQSMQRIREFVATHPDLKSNDSTTGGIKAHKILFCTTSIGKIAFVRQIEPHVHVEVDAGVVRDLERHVPRIVHIPTSPEQAMTPTVPNVIHVGDSFAGYFSLISSKERL